MGLSEATPERVSVVQLLDETAGGVTDSEARGMRRVADEPVELPSVRENKLERAVRLLLDDRDRLRKVAAFYATGDEPELALAVLGEA